MLRVETFVTLERACAENRASSQQFGNEPSEIGRGSRPHQTVAMPPVPISWISS